MNKAIEWFVTAAACIIQVAGCSSVDSGDDRQLRALVDAMLTALNRADIDAFEQLFTTDATAFLPIGQVAGELVGRKAIRDVLEPFLDDVRARGNGPEYMHLTAGRIRVQIIGEAAVVTFDAGSGPVTSRRTLVTEKVGREWKIKHFHGSNIRREE